MENLASETIDTLNYIQQLKQNKVLNLSIRNENILIDSFNIPTFLNFLNPINTNNYSNCPNDCILSLQKPVLNPPPSLPEELHQYVQNIHNPLNEPVLDLKNNFLSNSIDYSKNLFENYLSVWRLWAESENKKNEQNNIYKKWFNLTQQLKEDGRAEKYEVVCGLGITYHRNHKKEKGYAYPLLIQTCEIIIEEKSPYTIFITKALMPLKINNVYLNEMGFDNISIKKIENEVDSFISNKKDFNILNKEDYSNLLDVLIKEMMKFSKFRVKILDENINLEEHEDILIQKNSDYSLLFSPSWVVFEKLRSQDRVLKDIENIKREIINNDNEILSSNPLINLLNNVVSEEEAEESNIVFSNVNFDKNNNQDLSNFKEKHLFFPLNYNKNQLNVLKKLENNNIVLVNAPNGTGKSHSIINYITQYLAENKRVLVVSNNAHTLEDLNNNIPEYIKSLCISLLSSDEQTKKEFSQSLIKINEKVKNFLLHNLKDENEKNISNLKSEIDIFYKEIIDIEDELQRIYNLCNKTYDLRSQFISGYQNPYNIVQVVDNLSDTFNWLNEDINVDINNFSIPQLKITEDEYDDLKCISENLNEYICRCNELFPFSLENKHLPDIEIIKKFHSLIIAKEGVDLSNDPLLNVMTNVNLSNLDLIISLFTQYQELNRSLLKSVDINVAGFSFDTKRNGIELAIAMQRLSSSYNNDLEKDDCEKYVPVLTNLNNFEGSLEKNIADLSKYRSRIKMDESLALDKDCLESLKIKLSGGVTSILKNMKMPPKGKKWLSEIIVDGALPDSVKVWDKVRSYVNRIGNAENQIKYWKKCCAILKISEEVPNDYLLASEFINIAVSIIKDNINKYILLLEVTKKLNYELSKSFKNVEEFKGIKVNYSLEELYKNENKVKQISALQEKIHLKQQYDYLKNHIEEEYLSKYRKCLEQSMTENVYSDPIICKNVLFFFQNQIYSLNQKDMLSKWSSIEEDINKMTSIQSLLSQWTQLIEKVSSNCPNLAIKYANGNKVKDYEEFKNAWEFLHIKKLSSYFNLNDGYQNLLKERKMLFAKKEKLEEKLTEMVVWNNLVNDINEEKYALLKSYIVDLSKNVIKNFSTISNIIPCWIMPLERVGEHLSYNDYFDLIIIDDASKVNITALPAILRAKKILVMGDKIQYKPLNNELFNKDLSDFLPINKNPKLLLPENSLFDICNYFISPIKFNKHYRSNQHIVEFVNKNFYDNNLICLKKNSNGSISTPLINVYVKNSDINDYQNQNEVDAVTQTILDIINSHDPCFKNKTIGVISLTSNKNHIDLLNNRIYSLINEKERIDRKISVADATHFQSRQRDIILISSFYKDPMEFEEVPNKEMVLNLAISGAKELLYLFHSIDDVEKYPASLITSLIRYMKNPVKNVSKLNDFSFAKTDFEYDLSKLIYDLGYNIRLNSTLNSYNIDIVVYGKNNKNIGIFCDVDKPKESGEQFLQSIEKQDVLEKIDWQILRILATDFYLNRCDFKDKIREIFISLEVLPIEERINEKFSKNYDVEILRSNDLGRKSIKMIEARNDINFVNNGDLLTSKNNLKKITFSLDLNIDELRSRCENSFETIVFDALTDLGYMVYPQYSFDPFKLDLIVWDEDGNCVVIDTISDPNINKAYETSNEESDDFLSLNGFNFIRCYHSEYVKGADLLWKELDMKLKEYGVLKAIKLN